MTDAPFAMTNHCVSLDTAAMISGRSKRTWQRRITDGLAAKITAPDGRTMILLSDVAPLVDVPMTPEDLNYLVLADLGDADAQSDMGELFSAAGKAEIAQHWLRLAVAQDQPDAMHAMSRAFASGAGVERNDEMAVMWLAKASAFGHVIAGEQLRNLTSRALR